MEPRKELPTMSHAEDVQEDQLFELPGGRNNKQAEAVEIETMSQAEEKKIIRKMDLRLIIPLGLMLAANLMDRTNMGNAAIAGMTADLQLSVHSRYNIILLVFFGPYVVFQFPCAIAARKLGPRVYLPAITFGWGIIMLCFAFVHDWKVMIALRMLLGAFEAGLFGGAIYLLALWYTRYEVHKRYSSFYLISLLGAGFSGILAYVFSLMGGLGGLAAWRWIFVMEGLVTVLVAAVAYAMMVGTPQKADRAWRFLTREEAAFVMRRLARDRQEAEEDESTFRLAAFLRPARDLQIWAYGFLFFFSTVVAYAISYFLPIILLRQLGFQLGVAQLLSTPPYVYACILMFLEAWLCDRIHLRGPVVIFNSLQAIVGLCLLAWTPGKSGVQYFGVFLIAGGCHSNLPAIMAWQTNNIRGQWKRAFSSASLIGMGGTGGIVGSLVYRTQDAPRYLPGIYASIVCYFLSIIVSIGLMIWQSRANKMVEQGRKVIEGLDGFRYTL